MPPNINVPHKQPPMVKPRRACGAAENQCAPKQLSPMIKRRRDRGATEIRNALHANTPNGKTEEGTSINQKMGVCKNI